MIITTEPTTEIPEAQQYPTERQMREIYEERHAELRAVIGSAITSIRIFNNEHSRWLINFLEEALTDDVEFAVSAEQVCAGKPRLSGISERSNRRVNIFDSAYEKVADNA